MKQTPFAAAMLNCVGLASLAMPGVARADCPSTNRFQLNFSSFATQTLNYTTSYSTAVSNGLGQSRTMGISFNASNLASSLVSGIQMPAISNLFNDGGTINNLTVGGIFTSRTANISANNRTIATIFTFAIPIRDFTIQINDIDYTIDQFRDWLEVVGTNGAPSYVPALVTPFGTNNSAAGPHSNINSSQTIGVATNPVAVTVSQSVGTSVSANNSNTGTVTASFAEPVTRVEVRYGNYPLQSGETLTGQQGIGIQSISFCPMPDLTVTKASASFATGATDPARFATPGSDIIYSITVTNTNSSAVDANQLVLTDPLPPELIFFNGDIDDAGPVTTNFEFVPGASGLTLSPANLTYSNNGGASFGATPAAGYDVAVNALRINPQGALAPNSSFTVRFRARIK
jgi:uncharacterized repeat protein (TIGR01451 family)